MNTNGDQEHKDDLLLDLNNPMSAEQVVEGNTKSENPRGDTLRTDIQGTDTYSEASEKGNETDELLNLSLIHI